MKSGAMGRISAQLGVNPETLRTWVKRIEIDEGLRRARPVTMRSGSRIWSVRTVS